MLYFNVLVVMNLKISQIRYISFSFIKYQTNFMTFRLMVIIYQFLEVTEQVLSPTHLSFTIAKLDNK